MTFSTWSLSQSERWTSTHLRLGKKEWSSTVKSRCALKATSTPSNICYIIPYVIYCSCTYIYIYIFIDVSVGRSRTKVDQKHLDPWWFGMGGAVEPWHHSPLTQPMVPPWPRHPRTGPLTGPITEGCNGLSCVCVCIMDQLDHYGTYLPAFLFDLVSFHWTSRSDHILSFWQEAQAKTLRMRKCQFQKYPNSWAGGASVNQLCLTSLVHKQLESNYRQVEAIQKTDLAISGQDLTPRSRVWALSAKSHMCERQHLYGNLQLIRLSKKPRPVDKTLLHMHHHCKCLHIPIRFLQYLLSSIPSWFNQSNSHLRP